MRYLLIILLLSACRKEMEKPIEDHVIHQATLVISGDYKSFIHIQWLCDACKKKHEIKWYGSMGNMKATDIKRRFNYRAFNEK